jgi:DNA-binding CsgD family transcriptional regulator
MPLGPDVKLRVHLDVADPVTRRRLAALIKADPEIVVVAEAEEADVVVSERVIATAAPATMPQEGAALTPRELDVLRLVARGLGNKEIAAELDLSAHTVKYHLASVLAKLGVRSRTEAVSRGIRTGLLPL